MKNLEKILRSGLVCSFLGISIITGCGKEKPKMPQTNPLKEHIQKITELDYPGIAITDVNDNKTVIKREKEEKFYDYYRWGKDGGLIGSPSIFVKELEGTESNIYLKTVKSIEFLDTTYSKARINFVDGTFYNLSYIKLKEEWWGKEEEPKFPLEKIKKIEFIR